MHNSMSQRIELWLPRSQALTKSDWRQIGRPQSREEAPPEGRCTGTDTDVTISPTVCPVLQLFDAYYLTLQLR